jgi:hypothetical protein
MVERFSSAADAGEVAEEHFRVGAVRTHLERVPAAVLVRLGEAAARVLVGAADTASDALGRSDVQRGVADPEGVF